MSSRSQMAKDSTTAATTKGGEKPNDTRLATQAKQASRKAAKRKSPSIKRTIEEAKLLLGSSAGLADVNSGRQLRKHSAPTALAPPKKVNRKGAGRPPKKAKAENSAAAANSVSAEGATAASA